MASTHEPAVVRAPAADGVTATGAAFADKLELCRTALVSMRARFGALVASLGVAEFADDELCVLTDAAVADDELPSFVSFPITTRMLLVDVLGSSDVRTIAADDYAARYPTVASVVRRPGVHTLVAVGFRADGVTGAVSLGLPVPPDARIRADLQAVAATIGDALARWERHARRDAHAAELQRSLNPGDRSGSTSLVRRCVAVPATPAHAIGGDWYDVFDLPDGRVVAVVGDVAGRGTEAVLTMAQASASLRALLVRDGSPERALEHLDEFCAVSRAVAGTSCVIAVVDADAGWATVAHAGHPSALVERDGRFEAVHDGHGPLVGFPDGPRRCAQVSLAAGRSLVLVSNGVIASGAERGVHTPDDLARAAGPVTGLPPAMLVAQLLQGWTTAVAPADDVVVVALQHHDPAHPTCSFTDTATPEAITRVRHRFADWFAVTAEPLVSVGVVATDVELVVSELMANVVEHAYRGAPPGKVVVEAVAGPTGVELAVVDDGHWSSQISDTSRGHGLAIVRSLASSVTVTSTPYGTVVRARFDASDDTAP